MSDQNPTDPWAQFPHAWHCASEDDAEQPCNCHVALARAEVERRHAEEVARWEATVTALQKTVAMLEEHIAEDGHAEELDALKATSDEGMVTLNRLIDAVHGDGDYTLANGWRQSAKAAIQRVDDMRAQLAAVQKKRDETREWEHW